MAIDRLNFKTTDKSARIVVNSRRMPSIYFFAPIILGFSIAAVVSIFPVFQRIDFPTIGKFLFSLFFLLFLYMGLTSILALLWTLFGKDCITIESHGIRVDRVLFLRFSSRYYQTEKMFNIYVNSRDYEVNKISRGRNDFMSVFRIGTIHFTYDNKLHHRGGLTDEDGKIFLARFNATKL